MVEEEVVGGGHNQLGFALQLGALRYLGFCPDDLTTTPTAVVDYLASQLDLAPDALAAYGTRAQARTDHLREIRTHLHFRTAASDDLNALQAWLVGRALEHDRPTLLLQLAAEKLLVDKIVRPGVTSLERLVVAARGQAQEETYQRMAPLLTDERRTALDELLKPDADKGGTPLTWLRRRATTYSPRAILATIEKLAHLRQLGVDAWDLSDITPNRLKHLAQLGKKTTNQALQRAPQTRRYPILLAFLSQMLIETTDEVVDLYIQCLGQTDARSRRDLDEFRRTAARATNEKVHLFRKLGQIVLDPKVSDGRLRAAIYRQISKDKLQTAVEECEQLVRPLDDNYFDFLARRYSYVRSFAPAFLDTCRFRSHREDDPLIEAIALLRKLNQENRRNVPEDASTVFVPAKWSPYVTADEGQINRRYYELCLLSELRNALRAGNIWLEDSRRYADPESYLISRTQWPTL
ncbi:MAG: DUF4158 domain-containing protein, partial [Anaerolineae bacterium]